MTDENIKFNLSAAAHRLLENEPFYGALSRQINKSASTALPTIGVRFNKDLGGFELMYNPKFMASLEDTHVSGVLKHEFLHILWLHVTSRKPEDVKPIVWNFAADLAINSHLQGQLPENCLMPGVGKFEKYPHGLSAEAYLKMLQDDDQFQDNDGAGDGSDGNADGEGQPGEGGGSGFPSDGQFDAHEGWGQEGQEDADGEAGEGDDVVAERVKQMVGNAAAEVQKRGSWGSVPAECKKQIDRLIHSAIDWKSTLRYFVKTSQRAAKRSSIKRINKRFPYIHAGRRTERTAKILVMMDQSGSVSDAMISAFAAEMRKLGQYAEFTLANFDTAVDLNSVRVWKKGQTLNLERTRWGGTNFEAPTKYANEHRFDGMIILTDLEAPKPGPCRCQRLWITTESYARNPYFQTREKVVGIPDKDMAGY